MPLSSPPPWKGKVKEMEKDILQYSIDIKEPTNGKSIVKALEKAGIEVVGIDWKATWTHEDYWSGKPPYSHD